MELLNLRNELRYSVSNNGTIYLYKLDKESNTFVRLFSFDDISDVKLFIKAIGYKRLDKDDWDEEQVPDAFKAKAKKKTKK